MTKLKLMLTWYLVAAMFVIGVTPNCFAGFSPSEITAPFQMERSHDLQKLQNFLETKMVRERLNDLGFTQEEIRMKLESLSDPQVHQLALRLDELKVAGDGGAVLIIALLVAILVVLIIYATGHKIVIE